MSTIESFGVLQFIEVTVVLMALAVVWFFVRGQKPMQDATVDALKNAGATHQQLIEVVQRNTAATMAAERATEAQSRSFVEALERVVDELVTARSADGTQREQLREAVEKTVSTYGKDVSERFDAIKLQLLVLEALVAATPPHVGPSEVKDATPVQTGGDGNPGSDTSPQQPAEPAE
jgi:endo-alpha-1,4-polygalactosaminidase (GH114 family)